MSSSQKQVTAGEMFRGVLLQNCPRCRTGKIYPTSIFRGFPKMNDECAVCHLWFEREEGYFLGAMIVDYAIAMVATTIFGAILWSFTHWSFEKLCVAAGTSRLDLYRSTHRPTALMYDSNDARRGRLRWERAHVILLRSDTAW
jgi:uncharacterized protein (DUF983 family)